MKIWTYIFIIFVTFVCFEFDVKLSFFSHSFSGTESAISELRNFGQHFLLKYIKAAEPPDAAYAIIRGGALRAREIYFPYMETRVLTLLRDLLPRTVDYINRWVYTTSWKCVL